MIKRFLKTLILLVAIFAVTFSMSCCSCSDGVVLVDLNKNKDSTSSLTSVSTSTNQNSDSTSVKTSNSNSNDDNSSIASNASTSQNLSANSANDGDNSIGLTSSEDSTSERQKEIKFTYFNIIEGDVPQNGSLKLSAENENISNCEYDCEIYGKVEFILFEESFAKEELMTYEGLDSTKFNEVISTFKLLNSGSNENGCLKFEGKSGMTVEVFAISQASVLTDDNSNLEQANLCLDSQDTDVKKVKFDNCNKVEKLQFEIERDGEYSLFAEYEVNISLGIEIWAIAFIF